MTRLYGRFSPVLFSAWFLFAACHSTKHVSVSRTETSNNSTDYKPLKKGELKRKYAAVLGVAPGKIKDERLYYFIDDWYGTPYKWGGNDQRGVDCSGLVCQLYSNVYGVKLRRTAAQQHGESRNFKRKKKFKEGDLVYFRSQGKEPTHVGVYLKNGYFFHAGTKGVTINHLDDMYWKRTYMGGGKVR